MVWGGRVVHSDRPGLAPGLLVPASPDVTAPQVILIGYRGSGKSTIMAAVARALGVPAKDLDALIEQRVGTSIAAMFATQGEQAFRAVEAEALRAALAAGPAVIATGGGVVELAANRECLGACSGVVIYLQAAAEVLAARLAADDGGRPSLTGAGVVAEVASVLERRDPWYRAVADAVVGVDAPVEDVVRMVLAIVENPGRKLDETSTDPAS